MQIKIVWFKNEYFQICGGELIDGRLFLANEQAKKIKCYSFKNIKQMICDYNAIILNAVSKQKIMSDEQAAEIEILKSENKKLYEIINTNSKAAQKKTKAKSKVFVPPTVEEVAEYCTSRQNGINPQHFIDYYDTANWCDSKGNKVKSWKQRIISWERSSKSDISDVKDKKTEHSYDLNKILEYSMNNIPNF